MMKVLLAMRLTNNALTREIEGIGSRRKGTM